MGGAVKKNHLSKTCGVEARGFTDALECTAIYPDARQIERSNPDNAYFECERMSSKDELLSGKFYVDELKRYLLEIGVAPETISKVYAYPEWCGGGDRGEVTSTFLTVFADFI